MTEAKRSPAVWDGGANEWFGTQTEHGHQHPLRIVSLPNTIVKMVRRQI